MPEFALPKVNNSSALPDVLNVVAKMQKELSWLLNNLDSLNVTEINTNITKVQSDNGLTVINGPLLQMYDNNSILRRKIGYEEGSANFIVEWRSPLGSLTAYIDSNGEIVIEKGTFKGSINVSNDITVGNKITVGDINSTNKQIVFYDFSGNTTEIETDINGKFYINNYQDIVINTGTSLLISGGSVNIGTSGGDTDISGSNVNISAINNINLSSPVYIGGIQVATLNDIPSSTSSNGLHNHGILTNTKLAVVDASLNITGYVEFVESGSHTHSI